MTKLAMRAVRWMRGALGTALWFGGVFAVLGAGAGTGYDLMREGPDYMPFGNLLLRLLTIAGVFGVVSGAVFSVAFTLMAFLLRRAVTARFASFTAATVTTLVVLDILNLTWSELLPRLALANAMGVAVVSAIGGIAGGSMVLLARPALSDHRAALT